MKIGKKMNDALKKQITNEFEAKMLYLQMAAYFDEENLKGFASWMHAQANEEDTHAMKIFQFINDRDGKVALDAVPKPKSNFKSPLEIAKLALGHERRVTELIHGLADLAEKEKDHATRELLDWFIAEQVEEEDQGQYMVDQLEMIGSDTAALLMLDRELAKRKE